MGQHLRNPVSAGLGFVSVELGSLGLGTQSGLGSGLGLGLGVGELRGSVIVVRATGKRQGVFKNRQYAIVHKRHQGLRAHKIDAVTLTSNTQPWLTNIFP